jgi:hypothetical protein
MVKPTEAFYCGRVSGIAMAGLSTATLPIFLPAVKKRFK